MQTPEYENRTEKISISLPSSLVELVDDHCNQNGYSRSGFMKKSVENQLLSEMKKKPLLDFVYQRMMA